MTEEKEGVDSTMSSLPDDPILRDGGDDSDGTPSSITDTNVQHGEEAETEELDEFGLPLPKIRINSRPPSSSRSESFASARSSIDELTDNEDDNADVEDNDVDDNVPEQTSPALEWPRVSHSTLPGAGHVKSSPFHAAPPKPADKNTIYAERAKDLVKVLPVSNSIFKRQESPVDKPLARSASLKGVKGVSFEEKDNSQQNGTPSQSEPQETANVEPDTTESEVKPKVAVSTNVSHSRNQSKASVYSNNSVQLLFEDPDNALNPSGASEWSHQLGVVQAELRDNLGKKSLDTEDWQTMPAFAAYDVYDDDGRLIAQEFQDSDDEYKGGAGKGYTRMNQDEDAQSADSMDENTQYLFKESLDDEDAKTPLSQMQATKELLTEGQRIAYVGLCKLTMVAMLRDVGRVRIKETRAAYESMTLWSQKMMIRLFTHMDIDSDEQVMIEQLSEHGVIPADLIPSLMINVEVSNPLASAGSGSDTASMTDQSILSNSSISSSPPSTPLSPPPIQSPSTLTSKKLNLDLRWTILCDLFLVLIADSIYDSRSRVLLERMGEHLGVEWLDITRFERRVTDALQIQEAGEQNWNDDALLESRAKQARNRRYMMMGLATLGGGLVIGLSAGLLAPVIGAGLGAAFTTVGISGTTGFLAGTGGAALITTTGVVTGSSIAGRGMARRTKNVTTFEFKPLHNNQRVNLLVTVSGWMSSVADDVRLPFSTLDPIVGDVISLLWEPETLRSMGNTMNLLATEVLTQSLQQILGQTVLVALMSSIQAPTLLTKLSYLIDNPWSTSLDRAATCGLVLADCLMNRHLGQRPISLVGFSLGARVIYYCLLELAKAKAYGLVQDVYLFGSPIIIKQKECFRAQSVVAGRFVNGYKRNDWILGYLFRATSAGLGRVAGLGPIENCGDIENLDCTEIVGGHLMYRDAIPKLMKEAGFLVVSEEFTEIPDPDPDQHRERQVALYDEIEEAKRLVAEEEEAAIKAGKKVKSRTRKSGFLGLWGKEIETKPVGYDGEARHSEDKKSPLVSQPPEPAKYDPHEEKGFYDKAKTNSPAPTKPASPQPADDNNVLFDLDKMRDELTANGVTVTSLESTLPPLVVSPPPAAPTARSLHRSSTTPIVTSTSRSHSPSLPDMIRKDVSTSSIDQALVEPRSISPLRSVSPQRSITPQRDLGKLVVDSQKSTLSPVKNNWEYGGEITMSFEPDSPGLPHTSTLNTPYLHQLHSSSSHSLGERSRGIQGSNVLSLPIERNVWDDEDYGSGGDITMSFE